METSYYLVRIPVYWTDSRLRASPAQPCRDESPRSTMNRELEQPPLANARVSRVIDRSNTRVPEHAHDWPMLSIFLIGSYSNETEIGERFIAGPSAVFYSPGAAHRNTVAADGFEQIEIEFDPTWLGRSFLPIAPVKRWIGGESRALAQAILPTISERRLCAMLRRFLAGGDAESTATTAWVRTITQQLKLDPALSVKDLARVVDRHPSWVGSAYRRATGEGLLATAARFRVERAARLLRETEHPFAFIALDAGFCDQSHMNRTFRRVLGRSPTAVREDRLRFRQLAVRARHSVDERWGGRYLARYDCTETPNAGLHHLRGTAP